MADITYTSPYPGGWRNKPDRSTPWNARTGSILDTGIAAATAQANLALSTALAGGGGGGGGGTVTIVAAGSGLYYTVTPTAGSSVTITDHGTYITLTP